MKKKYFILWLLLLLISCNKNSYINWSHGTLDEAIALNSHNQKLIMIDFYTDW